MTIDELIKKKEGQTFDCKSIQVEPRALAIPMVAMANADGGMLAIGISDKTRRIEGIDQYKEKVNELLRVPYDFCRPTIRVNYDYLPCKDAEGNDNHILLIYVPAGTETYCTQADEAYIRIGDKSKRLSFDERLQLVYDKGERYYEDQSTYGATLGDIDMQAVSEYTQRMGYGKSALEFLAENGWIAYDDSQKVRSVSNACILLFGNNPQRFFPRARTRFIRYEGTVEKVGAEMNVVKDVTFEGTIIQQVRKTIEFIETQIREHTFLGERGVFVTNRNYSKFAVQEMCVNSCCHRDYSIKGTEIQIKMFDNRLVFETPGNFPGQVRADNIRHTHFSRNPRIAQFLKVYDYVKEFGEGIDRICNELEKRGLSIPTFQQNAFILKATLMAEWTDESIHTNPQGFGKDFGETLSERQRFILDIISQNATITVQEIADKSADKKRTIEKDIAKLKEMGILKREGGRKQGYWVVIKN
ncbi:MAG: ATP-binding protein [Prevotellaceae bacterium]|nr:ATP-binding protein [Prevotellaceae bacterium]